MSKNFKHITVFITNANSIEESAAIHGDEIFYLSRDLFAKWTKKCINVLKDLIITFSTTGDIVWRDEVIKKISDSQITPSDFTKMINQKKLTQL